MAATTILNSTLMPLTSTQEFNVSTIFYTTVTGHQDYSDAPDTIPTSTRIFIGILLSVGVILGVFGNMLVWFAILRDRVLREQDENLLILNLAAADLLMSYLPMPIFGVHFVLFWPKWTFGERMCKIANYVWLVSALMSLLTMVLIGFNRCLIMRNKRIVKRRNATIILFTLWTFSIIYFGIVIFPSNAITEESFKHGEINVCFHLDTKVVSERSPKIFLLNIFLISAIFMQLASLVIYAGIGFFLWRVRNRHVSQRLVRRGINEKIRALVLAFTVTLAFFLCWMPNVVAWLLRIFPMSSEDRYINPTFKLIANSLAMFNSSINPFLYALISKKFRVAFRRIFPRPRAGPTSFSQHDTNEDLRRRRTSNQTYGSVTFTSIGRPTS